MRPRLLREQGKTRVAGYISSIAVTQINLPHALRPALEGALIKHKRSDEEPFPHFEATLAIGQRLEPWLESLTPAP